MTPITTETAWLNCDDPLAVARYVARSERFRWLAVVWGRWVRHLFDDYESGWFDAYAAWVAGAGLHPREVCPAQSFVPVGRPRDVVAFARFCVDYLERDNPLQAAASAAEAASLDCPFPPFVPPPDPARSAAERDAEKARADTHRAAWAAAEKQHRVAVGREFADQFRDIAGNPFRPVVFVPGWLTSDVVGLARAADADPAAGVLPILADALEDAGCDSAELLAHCRHAGGHVRGCWAVDGLLGRL